MVQGSLVKELLQKLEEKKEQDNNEPDTLLIFSHKIDINSLYALNATLPKSNIHTIKFSNNEMTATNFEYLIECINNSLVTRFYFDWNPILNSNDSFAKL